ncbi:glycine/D-amino acid oxidase-like deaminating enzyme [Algoriphagus sp. 4150]|uniref:NAD(P)/FAD-dependent oxidoreductase n=1 Tax=Algoriphagus sp. 4150 TaxID=2817756 RepID=UPI00286634F6|nr:FAD-dependent oxidoreductase [Algoriphagus sp. 4150]MDR7132219.1 glycine/D-amino acid oxidase-like deaminating enzyme [Algoriphagus sp. 4150]
MKRRNFIHLSAIGLGASIIPSLSPLPVKASGIPISKASPEVLVIGAGAFGGWTAYHLRKKGISVTLLDAYGPGNSRASSGGETRLMQVDNDNHVYVKSGIRAFGLWKELEEVSGQKLVLPTGRLAMSTEESFKALAMSRKEQLQKFDILDTEILDQDEIRRRWPQIFTDDLQSALYNSGGPAGSTLMARKGCQTVASEFTKLGGKFQIAQAMPLISSSGEIEGIKLANGEVLRADHYVFACGPWLGKIFPDLLAKRLQVQRRDVLFYGLPPGDARFAYPNFPEWSVQGSGWYGFPDIENRGLKAAPYPDHNSIDPDTDERIVTAQQIKRGHDFLRHRFPTMANMPITETRVCQVTNSTDSNFIIDKHPEMDKVWIAGGGSGHGFKHGPSVGEYVSQRVLGEATPEDYDNTFKLKEETF